MGSFFKSPKLENRSTLSANQQALLQLLSGYIGGPATSLPSFYGPMTEALNRNTTAEGQALGERMFREGLLNPALRAFDTDIAPRINASFGGISGALSSRRSEALTEALGDVTTQAQAGLAQLLPTAMSFPLQQTLSQIQGLGALESLRYQPFELASRLATSPTNQTVQSPQGPGWGLLNSGLGAGGFLLGSYLGRPTQTINNQQPPANRNEWLYGPGY